MCKLLGLTLGTIFLTTFLYGQEITKEEIVKFQIKSITTIDGDDIIKSIDIYNDKGDIVRINDKKNDEIKTRKEFIYNDNSLLTEERTFNTEGRIHRISKYTYNTKNQLVKEESFDPDKIDLTWTYEYDETGNKIKATKASGTMGNSVTLYKYSGKQLIEEQTTTESIGKEEKITYKYNDKGQVTENKSKHFYFNTTITLTYIYDDTGKLMELREKSSNGVSSRTTYQYDDKGLLVGDTWKSSLDKTPNKTRYIIEF
ncbi:hypothetical protein [Chryseosolibacter indicus]|uniref:YD repeat-containing protein n=1 Tax=Chryseosolibacter indicus TaxID=2782351 RepID=A0ABS5VVH0_9BACT|nr:hypothetical protein [Chryseosolibacter indicus]MBT1705432.1 hypothetical protein [Chryseosolibacter indicus]